MHDGRRNLIIWQKALEKKLNERIIVKWPIASLKGIN